MTRYRCELRRLGDGQRPSNRRQKAPPAELTAPEGSPSMTGYRGRDINKMGTHGKDLSLPHANS